MGKLRFTQPGQVERVDISEGDWIEIKKDLNNGETKRLEAAGLKPPIEMPNGRIVNPVDWERYEIERAAIFLTGWSLIDFKGQPTAPSIETLKSLDPADFDEINAAIVAYVKQRAAAKKALREPKEETSKPQESTVSEQT